MPCGSGNLLGITGGVWQRSPSIQATNSMSWYYAIGQEQKGPVTDDQLQALVRDGVITGDTLVWREGMAGWQAYRTIVPPGTLPATGAATISTSPAPAGPEGVPQSRGRGEADFFQTDYEVLIGYAWSRGWRAFSNSAGLMIGGGLLLFLIAMVAVAIPVVSLIVTGPLTGGLYWLYLRCVRGEAAVLGDGFAGFGPQFIQLLLGNVVSGLLALLPLIPGALVLVVGGLTMAAVKRGDLQMLGGGMLLLGALWESRKWSPAQCVRWAGGLAAAALLAVVALTPLVEEELRSNQTLRPLGLALRREFREGDVVIVRHRIPQGLPFYAHPVISATRRPYLSGLPEHRMPFEFPGNRARFGDRVLKDDAVYGNLLAGQQRVLVVGFKGAFANSRPLARGKPLRLIAQVGDWELFTNQ